MDEPQKTFILPPDPLIGREEYLRKQQARFAKMMKRRKGWKGLTFGKALSKNETNQV